MSKERSDVVFERASPAAAAGGISYGQVLSWLARHLPEAGSIFTMTESVLAASGLVARWEAIKRLGDTLVPIIDDFPTGAFAASNMEEVETKFTAMGFDGSRLEKLIPVLIQLLPVLLKLLGKS